MAGFQTSTEGSIWHGAVEWRNKGLVSTSQAVRRSPPSNSLWTVNSDTTNDWIQTTVHAQPNSLGRRPARCVMPTRVQDIHPECPANNLADSLPINPRPTCSCYPTGFLVEVYFSVFPLPPFEHNVGAEGAMKTCLDEHIEKRDIFRESEVRTSDAARAASEATRESLVRDAMPGYSARSADADGAQGGEDIRNYSERVGPTEERVSSQTASRVAMALRLIQDLHQDPDLRLSRVAAGVGLSTCHASRSFTAVTGRRFTQHLHDARVTRGLALLRQPRLSIKEIAHVVGYRRATEFSRQFQLRFNITPSVWRWGARASSGMLSVLPIAPSSTVSDR